VASSTKSELPPGSHRALRLANERRILAMLRRDGPSSQAHLARATRLSRATVNNIAKSLAAEGVLDVRAGATGRETTVSLAAPHGTLVAVDLGHRRIHGSLISLDAKTRLDEFAELGREEDGGINLQTLAAVVHRLLERAGILPDEVRAVCVGLHAPFDASSGRIAPTAILPGWEGFDVRAALRERLGFEVIVDNDANFAALAEWTWGAGRGSDHFLYVKSSNGIGAGLVLDGRLYRGSNGMAGELGHIVVDDRGAVCNCGNRGCLSAVASGRALLLQLQAAGNVRTSLRDVIEGARAGDAACARVLVEAGHHLGTALAHVVKVIAPSTIAIGGELAAAGSLVFDSVQSAITEHSLRAVAAPVRILEGIRRADMCILGCVAAMLTELGAGISDLPEWLLRPTDSRIRGSA
jgi:predicted NBD/HSP70 family sugar kinase